MKPCSIAALVVLTIAGQLLAQDYALKALVIDEGGKRLTSGGYTCGLSIGQPVASFWLAGSGYKAMLGFWPHPYGGSIPGVTEPDVLTNAIPLAFDLGNVSPNPFDGHAAIRYALPRESDVALRVYNSVGRVVTTLVSGKQQPGRYTVRWDVGGVLASRLPAGTYFCRLEAGDYTATRKMVKTD